MSLAKITNKRNIICVRQRRKRKEIIIKKKSRNERQKNALTSTGRIERFHFDSKNNESEKESKNVNKIIYRLHKTMTFDFDIRQIDNFIYRTNYWFLCFFKFNFEIIYLSRKSQFPIHQFSARSFIYGCFSINSINRVRLKLTKQFFSRLIKDKQQFIFLFCICLLHSPFIFQSSFSWSFCYATQLLSSHTFLSAIGIRQLHDSVRCLANVCVYGFYSVSVCTKKKNCPTLRQFTEVEKIKQR